MKLRQRIRRDRWNRRSNGPPESHGIEVRIGLAASGGTKRIGRRPLHGAGEIGWGEAIGLLNELTCVDR